MENRSAKPKLVFFRYRYGASLPDFVRMHREHQLKCLSEFFEVVVIREDCDYLEVCDRNEPDLALFEMMGDGDISTSHRLNIQNASKNAAIPKLALLNADAWSRSRAGFISDMEHWGIETAFSICTTAARYTPALADNLFVWPNFVDTDIYRDHGCPKIIPVLFTGARSGLYPWRKEIHRVVSEVYPSMLCPHAGYSDPAGARRMVQGEAYARAINASWFVPACGTLAKEVLRKHFEIPACRSCLITDGSPGLAAAGFRDMENCVVANVENILDKLDHLFRHPEEMERIINAGYQLVHSRHTYKQRDQIFQWYKLQRERTAGQKIVQRNPFDPPVLVEESSGGAAAYDRICGTPVDRLGQGDARLFQGRYDEASDLYVNASNALPWAMPEPKFRLALCKLYQGDAKAAYAWLIRAAHYLLAGYKSKDPDPVEWAYCIIALVCMGRLDMAHERSAQFPWLRHPELDRARWVARSLNDPHQAVPVPQHGNAVFRHSIHELPARSFSEWLEQIIIMLNACGRRDFANALAGAGGSENSSAPPVRRKWLVALRGKAIFMGLRCEAFFVRIGWMAKKKTL